MRQGCPLSPYLFILSAEVLSVKIRQDSSVKGIKIFGNEIKLSQFENDTNLFTTDLASVENALKIVGDFGNIARNQGQDGRRACTQRSQWRHIRVRKCMEKGKFLQI